MQSSVVMALASACWAMLSLALLPVPAALAAPTVAAEPMVDTATGSEGEGNKDCSFSASYPQQYVVYKTATPPVMDGSLDDPLWKEVPFTQDFVDISTASRPRLLAPCETPKPHSKPRLITSRFTMVPTIVISD